MAGEICPKRINPNLSSNNESPKICTKNWNRNTKMWQMIRKVETPLPFHQKRVTIIHRKTHWPGNLSTKSNHPQIFNLFGWFARQAVNEIVRDSEKASKLIDEFGPSSCHRSHPYHKTNKRFLANTMRSVVNHNKRTTDRGSAESKRKFDEIEKRKPKFGHRMHSFQRAEERMTTKKWPDVQNSSELSEFLIHYDRVEFVLFYDLK